MDASTNEILTEVRKLSSKLVNLEDRIRNIERKSENIFRELGTREGIEMHRQVDEIYENDKERRRKINEIERAVIALQKLLERNAEDIKEIKQALALIYRNTDELEDHFMGEDRQTR